MNIYTDGARSRKRLSVAKKAVAKLRALGIAKKVGIRDGFLYKVTKEGRGWIKAPFGIYVVLVDEKGVRQFTCDSVGSPALPYFDAIAKDRYVLMPDPLSSSNTLSEALAGAAGTQMLLADPRILVQLPQYQIRPFQWGAPIPLVMPVGAENVALSLPYTRTSLHNVVATQITHCYNDGKNDATNDVESMSFTQVYLPAINPSVETGTPVNGRYYRSLTHTSPGRWCEVRWKEGWLAETTTENTLNGRLLSIDAFSLKDGSTYRQVQRSGTLLTPIGFADYNIQLNSVMVSKDASADVEGNLPESDAARAAQIRAVVTTDAGMVFLDYASTHTSKTYESMTALSAAYAEDGDLWWAYTRQSISARIASLTTVAEVLAVIPRGVFDAVASPDSFPQAPNILKGNYWLVGRGGDVTTPDPNNPALDVVRTLLSLTVLIAEVDNASPTNSSHWSGNETWAGGNLTSTKWFVDFGTIGVGLSTVEERRVVIMRNLLLSVVGDPFRSSISEAFPDTVSFPDAEGVMYSWMRITDPSATQDYWGQAYTMFGGPRHGGIKFSAVSGFTRIPLTMPDSVRLNIDHIPVIQLINADFYVCIARSWDNKIHDVSIGSPFTGIWVSVGVPADAIMYSVRTASHGDAVSKFGFLGVGKVTGEDYEYYLFFKPPGAPWVRLSPIPLVNKEPIVDVAAAWDVCVFGDDALVGNMLSCLQHPASRPEIAGKNR